MHLTHLTNSKFLKSTVSFPSWTKRYTLVFYEALCINDYNIYNWLEGSANAICMIMPVCKTSKTSYTRQNETELEIFCQNTNILKNNFHFEKKGKRKNSFTMLQEWWGKCLWLSLLKGFEGFVKYFHQGLGDNSIW